ncbi:hypothetical protein BIY28_15260 [Brenneria goodwinii]|nr:hypothetical protein BIY28_15260 [Brenneria goodwinii]
MIIPEVIIIIISSYIYTEFALSGRYSIINFTSHIKKHSFDGFSTSLSIIRYKMLNPDIRGLQILINKMSSYSRRLPPSWF